jgi:hypothetical protein
MLANATNIEEKAMALNLFSFWDDFTCTYPSQSAGGNDGKE